MFFEIYLISKLQLLIGHPGQVVAIVLGSIILFTGVGSLISSHTMSRWRLNPGGIALGVVGCMFLFGMLFDLAKGEIIAWPFAAKCAVAFLMPAIPCSLMGHLFPTGIRRLSRMDAEVAPWAFAVNGVSGTLASGMVIVVAQAFGYNSMLLLGCLCYMIVCLVELRSRKKEMAVEAELAQV